MYIATYPIPIISVSREERMTGTWLLTSCLPQLLPTPVDSLGIYITSANIYAYLSFRTLVAHPSSFLSPVKLVLITCEIKGVFSPSTLDISEGFFPRPAPFLDSLIMKGKAGQDPKLDEKIFLP